MSRISIFKKREFPVWAAEVAAALGFLVYFTQSLFFAYSTVSNLDEGAYLLKGYLFASGEYRPFDSGISTTKAPLAFLIPGYAQLLFGPGLRTGRYLAVFFGCMAVIGTWFASRRLGGKWLAAGAVWVLACSPMVIKFYSGGATQSTIACLLAWALALSLGEKRPFWELMLAGFFAGLMMMVRENMLPVLPLLSIYVFWLHGWRKFLGFLIPGTALVAVIHFIYWPYILQLWYWLPLVKIPLAYRYTGGGTAIHWQPEIFLGSRLLSIFQAIRFHFVPLVGSFFALLFFPKIKNWKSRADFGTAVFLGVLFLGLLYMHYQAAIVRSYCVFCFSPYISFFNIAAILLIVVSIRSWNLQPRRLSQISLIVIFMIIAAGIGFSFFEKIGADLLQLPAPRFRGFQILSGFVTWRDILSNGFDLKYNLSMRYASAAFGFVVGLFTLLTAYVVWARIVRSRFSMNFTIFFSYTLLVFGIVLSPMLSGNVSDCDIDVIAANEKNGLYLSSIIPRESLVYWDGGLSAAPLLYLPNAKIFPAQINSGYTFRSGGDTAKVIRFGLWNEELDAEWKSIADFFIIEDGRYVKWKTFLTPNYFDEFPRSPVGTSCLPESYLRIFRRK